MYIENLRLINVCINLDDNEEYSRAVGREYDSDGCVQRPFSRIIQTCRIDTELSTQQQVGKIKKI